MADGETVAVFRGVERIDITARGVPISYETQRGDVTLQAQRVDWLIRREDYVFDGLASDPEEGDLIQRTSGGRVETYEVQPMDTEGCFHRLDTGNVNLQVYTRLIEEEAA